MKTKTRASGAMALLLWTVVAVPTARAQQPDPVVHDVRWSIDLPILGAALIGWGAPSLLLTDAIERSCPCDRSRVPGFDRVSLGRNSDVAARTSDIGLMTILAAPLVAEAIALRGDERGPRAVIADIVVVGQAVAITGAITGAFKYSVQRARPYTYGLEADDPRLRDADAYLSFYSGHSATAFAGATAWATTFAHRWPKLRGWAWAAGPTAAAGVASLRIVAGRHFPSDVLVGAAVGTSAGLVVPWLHRRQGAPAVVVTARGALLVGAF